MSNGQQPVAQAPGTWAEPRKILVILAHPDDPEFFCGATLARWARAGHHIEYCLMTCGDKGYNETTTPEHVSTAELCGIRHAEQRAAASVIGALAVHFLERPEATSFPILSSEGRSCARSEASGPISSSRAIRRHYSPPTESTTPITRRWPGCPGCCVSRLRQCVVLPGTPGEGLQPHMPEEIWCALTNQPPSPWTSPTHGQRSWRRCSAPLPDWRC